MDVSTKVKKCICDVLGTEVNISDDANLMYDYNMDSIQIMNVIVQLEDEFDIEFEFDDLNIDNMLVFSKLVDMVNRMIE